MPYQTTARGSKIAAINVEDLDLEQRRALSAPKAATAAPASGGTRPPSQNGQIWSATIMDGYPPDAAHNIGYFAFRH